MADKRTTKAFVKPLAKPVRARQGFFNASVDSERCPALVETGGSTLLREKGNLKNDRVGASGKISFIKKRI